MTESKTELSTDGLERLVEAAEVASELAERRVEEAVKLLAERRVDLRRAYEAERVARRDLDRRRVREERGQ